MPFGWAGDATWRATMSIRRAPIPTLDPERREDPSAGRGRGGGGRHGTHLFLSPRRSGTRNGSAHHFSNCVENSFLPSRCGAYQCVIA